MMIADQTIQDHAAEIHSVFEQADGILIAAANGFSISEGFAILRNSPWFSREFADFQSKYGFQAPIQGLTYPYKDSNDFRSFYTRLMKQIHYDKPVSKIMKDLQSITENYPCFILTTNGEDRFVQAGYPEQDVFYLEGRFNHRVDHTKIERSELDQITSGEQLETATYPNSPAFEQKLNDLNQFLAAHPHLLILELGVSARNGWIRPILQQILSGNPQSFCIELNQIPNPVPQTFSRRVLQISGNMQDSLSELKAICGQQNS